jgi:hypothetical protein
MDILPGGLTFWLVRNGKGMYTGCDQPHFNVSKTAKIWYFYIIF